MKVTEDTAKCKSVCFPQYNFSYLEPPFKFNSFSESLKKKKLELKIKNFFQANKDICKDKSLKRFKG